MTIKELMNALAQFDENMEVKVYDNFGYWKDFVIMIPLSQQKIMKLKKI